VRNGPPGGSTRGIKHPVSERPLVSYTPNPVLAWAYRRFFEHIEVDASWAKAVREASTRGTVVYVFRNLSFVDFFALDHLTKRHDLPQIRFAGDMGLWILEPMGRGWAEALKPRTAAGDARDLRRAVGSGAAAALFLKRPPEAFEGKARGQVQGDDGLRTLLDLQRTMSTPILLVPQVFVWSRHADEAQRGPVDLLFGPREWPGKVRTVAQFALNYRQVSLRAGEPLDLKQLLESEAREEAEAGRDHDEGRLVRRITYTLLRRLERERHAILGPTKKPADRLREEVIRSPKLQKIIFDMAGEGEQERRVMTWRAHAMLREMEAALDLNAVAAMDVAVNAMVERIYSSEEVDEEGIARVRAAAKDGTLVFLPSHKSHIDYILLARIFFRRKVPMPLIAAGDNLNFFPLGPLLRRAGAFYIRRSFHGDRLYAAVVDAYVRRLLKDGYSLEFFLEGGRSRGGKLLSPKMGLLSLVVDAALAVQGRKVYFCPISIGYERVVEEKTFVREISGGEKPKEDVRGLVKSAGVMGGKYGRLNVQFGELFTLQQIQAEVHGVDSLHDLSRVDAVKLSPAKRRALVQRLAYRVMHEINRVTAVTPGSLVATALLSHDRRGLSHEELLCTCERLAGSLRRFGARFTPEVVDPKRPGTIRRSALLESIDLFVRAGNVEVHRAGALEGPKRRSEPGPEAVYSVPESARRSLDYSKNVLVHFFVARALVATALLSAGPDLPAPGEADETAVVVPGEPGLPTALMEERVRTLSRLFKHEFLFRADAAYEQIFADTVEDMVDAGELVRGSSGGGRLAVAATEDAQKNVMIYAQIMKPYLEGYLVAARGLSSLLKAPLAVKDLTKRSLTAGEKMYLAGEIARREAVNRDLFDNAFAAFVDQGYVQREDGKLGLTESYASAEMLRTVERRIGAFLVTSRD
jgi:glycerol-3-phosphate O-acyltransferase